MTVLLAELALVMLPSPVAVQHSAVFPTWPAVPHQWLCSTLMSILRGLQSLIGDWGSTLTLLLCITCSPSQRCMPMASTMCSPQRVAPMDMPALSSLQTSLGSLQS